MKIFVFNVPTDGHINPTLPVVRELVRRDVSLIYYLTESYRQKIESTGAEFRAYKGIPDDYFTSHGLDGSNPPKAAKTLLGTTRDLLPELSETVRAEKPDVILHDAMCPWGLLVAKYTKIPTAVSMSTLMLTPPMILQSGQFFSLVALILKNVGYLREVSTIGAEIKRTYGITAPGFPTIVSATGMITLNYTSEMIQPGAKLLDKSFRFVGPAIEPRPDTTNFPFEQLDGKPLIYISLGTVINENPEFFALCLRAFAGSEFQIVISVGRKLEIASLGTIPDNFIVRNFVPQLEILQRTALFITHAGLNSIHEGLYYNIPLLLVPQQNEQGFNAHRIQELGAGINLMQKPLTEASLLHSSRQLLQESRFRERAKILGDSLRSAGGFRRAADEIMAL